MTVEIIEPLLTAKTLAAGAGLLVEDVVCRAGPEQRPFEERHRTVSIAMVTAGSFQYRASVGDAVLAPGAIMLGGPGMCFECGHEHGIGDRCLAFHYEAEVWAGIVAAVPGAKDDRITQPQLPPREMLAPLFAEAEAARDDNDSDAMEEIAFRLGATVACTLTDAPRRARSPSSRDIKRVTASVRRIAEEPEVPHPLSALASHAAMSPYHFLRTFRQVVGMAPHQYVLQTRLHRAALRLRRTREEISAIAFAAGFNDLSTFNRRFKKVMGASPGTYRALGSPGASRR
jgi:AraC-like DNA-binding protein